jgi:hypothetical protein
MLYQRKNVDGAWFSFKLSKEDMANVEKATITHGLHTLLKINKTASENNIKLSDMDRAAMIVWSALTMGSFASDFIEAKVIEEQKAKLKEQAPQ